MVDVNTVIAIPTSDRINVDGHFGHTKEFAFFTIVDGVVKEQYFVIPPTHTPGVLPKFLSENGAKVIITGGMGAMAVKLFNNNSIDVILGAKNTLSNVVSKFINGSLESTASVCNHNHGDHDGCKH